ncbi:MAG: hypothetical protein GXO74_12130 [Calditrichaeota bacterium]|nr:hypothetical protein [Calditrichota bacterium]
MNRTKNIIGTLICYFVRSLHRFNRLILFIFLTMIPDFTTTITSQMFLALNFKQSTSYFWKGHLSEQSGNLFRASNFLEGNNLFDRRYQDIEFVLRPGHWLQAGIKYQK